MANAYSGADKPANGLTEKAYAYISAKINTLELLPDSKINVVKLAETLEMSRTPVRNALELLAEEGHVIQTEGGFKAPGIDPADLMSLTEARQMIEGTAAYMAAGVITKEELQALREAISESENALSIANMPLFAMWDNLFHEKIVRASRNIYLISMYKVLVPRIARYRHALQNFRDNVRSTDAGHACEKHMTIYTALKSRYSSLARDEMQEHLRFTNQYLLDLRSTMNK